MKLLIATIVIMLANTMTAGVFLLFGVPLPDLTFLAMQFILGIVIVYEMVKL